jgi:hypothetical protein
MSHFLLIFDRLKRQDLRVERIEDPNEAMTRLRDAERHLDEGQGAVLLVAESEEDLRLTHAHYFTSFDDLLASR